MNERDNKNTEIAQMAQNLSIFKDSGFYFLYQKTEKVATAIYTVSNFLNANEPMKWQLRGAVVRLLGKIMALSTTTMSGRPALSREISVSLFHTRSLFNISYRSGFISQMNYTIINSEIEQLINFFGEYDDSQLTVDSKLFDEKYFKVNVPKGQPTKTGGVVKDFRSTIESIKDTPKGHNNVLYKKRGDNKERRGKILEILKNQDNVSVKDISIKITDCSEKTLQRELSAMVEDGLIIKEGERRWSRYSVKQ